MDCWIFKGGGKLGETAALRRGIQETSRTCLGSNPNHWCVSSGLLPTELPERPKCPGFMCMGFMALTTALVLCARSQDLVISCQCVGYMSLSGLLDLRAEESRIIRHVKPPRCGEASRRPHALSRVRTQAIGALAPGSYPLSYPSARERVFIPMHLHCDCIFRPGAQELNANRRHNTPSHIHTYTPYSMFYLQT